MESSNNENIEFINNIKELVKHEKIQEMRNYIQHGNTTTLTHCLIVSYYSYQLSRRLPFHMNRSSIIRGAMLHDFYLYNWHKPEESQRLHGFVHAKFALANAKKYFDLNDIEVDIIKTHMWPLTLFQIPKSKEALLVCCVDKVCSLLETLYIPTMPKCYRQLMRLINTGKVLNLG